MSALLDNYNEPQLSFGLHSARAQRSANRPEAFFSDRRGVVTRSIRRRGDGVRPRTTRIGCIEGAVADLDLNAEADRLLLRRQLRVTRTTSGSPIRVVDLFSGCGGMSLGVREACDALGLPFEVAGAFDIERAALDVYERNFATGRLLPTDLGLVLNKDLEAPPSDQEFALLDSVGATDFLVAGPPCQGHSNLNNTTRRNDPRNELYFRVARFAELASPRFVLVENVMTVTKDKSRVVTRTKDALREMGYAASEAVVDLWTIGVPQMRRRHLLFAYLPNKGPFRENVESADAVALRYSVDPRTLKWAIEDLVDLGDSERADSMNVPCRPLPITQKRIDYLFDHGLFDLPDTQRPDCHRLKEHSYQSVYGRLRWDRPAPTITGGFDTMGRGRFVHPELRRTLTPREAARIQGFPDYFDFSPVSARRTLAEMIGNAVPPKLSYIFALECLR